MQGGAGLWWNQGTFRLKFVQNSPGSAVSPSELGCANHSLGRVLHAIPHSGPHTLIRVWVASASVRLLFRSPGRTLLNPFPKGGHTSGSHAYGRN